MIFADKDGLYIVLTIVFSVLAVLSLFAMLFTLMRFYDANRKVRLNESDAATKVGREYLSCSEELENLKKIYTSFQNDIS